MKYTVCLLSTLLVLGCAQQIIGPQKSNNKSLTIDQELFRHGVASGDPLTDRVIIWTRITTDHKKATVRWQVSESKDFSKMHQSGITGADHNSDYTVKVDVQHLNPGSTYYYRFITEGKSSPIGKTKTLNNAGDMSVRLGIVSCSNYEFGYFNAYHGLADENLDAVLHLGDYIYEYGPNKYGDKDFTRKHLPAKEITSLEDYRTRYAQYREDAGLQRVHMTHPFIMIWDDHEIANNAYKTGAQNHQDDEGDYMSRKMIAKKAYYEWQPIREYANDELYRAFQFGDLVDLFMLDERYTGRAAPPETPEEAGLERSMLGAQQLSWFKSELRKSDAKWKIIGNQEIFTPCDLSLVRPDSPVNLDAWDGYATERDDIRSLLTSAPISNAIFVTGDTHASWAFNVPALNYNKTGDICAIEIGTPSITSSNWNDGDNITDDQAIMGEQALMMSNPYLKYVNGRDHGYVVLDISNDQTIAKWYYTSDIKIKQAQISLAKEMKILSGSNRLTD